MIRNLKKLMLLVLLFGSPVLATVITGGPGIQDGDPYPYTQTISDIHGSFDVKMQASLKTGPAQLYVSTVSGLGIQKSPTNSAIGDYRQINSDEFLEMTITNFSGTSVTFTDLSGLATYFTNGVSLRLYKNNTNTLAATINCDGSGSYPITPAIVATNGDKVIFNPSANVRLEDFTVVISAPLTTNYSPYITNGVARTNLLSQTISTAGYYYVTGNWASLSNKPNGMAVAVGDQGNAATLYKLGEVGPNTASADLDLRVLVPGDTVKVVAGLTGAPGENPALWMVSLTRYEPWSGSRYTPAVIPWVLASPLSGLDVYKNLWPKHHGFRDDYRSDDTYTNFWNTVSEFLGHNTKCYAEEREVSAGSLPNMQRYALENPTRQVLIHWDGRQGKIAQTAMPSGVNQFKPYHFRYNTGTYLSAAAGTGATQFTVKTTAPFAVGSQDVAIVIPVDAVTGERLFDQSELVVITAVDDTNQTLTVQRNFNQPVLGYTSAGNFAAGAYIAPSIHYWGGDVTNAASTYFSYNFSSTCPRDSLGRNGGDISAEMLSAEFAVGGDLARFHGLAFDVLPRSAGASEDCDLDGFADGGLDPRGIDLFHLGVQAFAKKLRDSLPGRIFSFDGNSGIWPRLHTVLNGIESEGFTYHHDSYATRWSNPLNDYQFTERWNLSASKYNFCVPKQEDLPTNFPAVEKRLLNEFNNAALTILGVVSTYGVSDTNKVVHARDEFRRGTNNILQWLGAPVSGMIRPSLGSPDILGGAGLPAGGWSSLNGSAAVSSDPQGIRVSPAVSNWHSLATMDISRSGIAIPAGDLVIRFEGKGGLQPLLPSGSARYITITVDGRQASTGSYDIVEGAVNDQGFTEVAAYYRGAGPAGGTNVTLKLSIEGAQDMLLRNFTVHSAADVILREFENGVVLCNPSEDPYTFNLATLFPGKTFHRIQGQSYDNPISNDGSAVGATVQLDGLRGLFLVKDTSIVPAGYTVVSDTSNTNGFVDPGELVTLGLALRNSGAAVVSNIVATLLPSASVLSPSGAKSYGTLSPGVTVTSNFTFRANGLPGATLTATLSLQSGTNALGTVSFSLLLGRQIGGLSTFTNSAAITIPATGKAAPYPSTNRISNVTGTVTQVTARLKGFTHTRPQDLSILLVSPDGQKVMLMSNAGGTPGVTNVTMVFADVGGIPLTTNRIIVGTYLPTDLSPSDTLPTNAPSRPYSTNMNVFANTNPNGDWKLYINDDTGSNSGSLSNGWELALTIADGGIVYVNTPGSLHHLDLSSPGSPQYVGSPFNGYVSARDASSKPATNFTGSITLSAGSVTIDPTNAAPLINGTWNGAITALQTGTNVVLTASDGAGHTATSFSFHVLAAGTLTSTNLFISGTNLVIKLPTNTPAGWIVVSKTNLLRYDELWVAIAGSSNSTATIPIRPGVPAAFYRLYYP